MKKIDKNNEVAANAIIDSFLAWARGERWYGPDCGRMLYDMFGRPFATGFNNKQRLEDSVLLPEQDHRCCYCMKRIDDHADDATIEHIVPQSTTNAVDKNHYFSAKSGGLNATNVCLTSEYVNNGSTPPPYPHHVAYHNYAVACQSCNGYRWHHKIEPLFLFPGIEAEVTYNRNTGEMEWDNDPVFISAVPDLPTIDRVRLNRPLLKAIRAVWFYAKDHGISPATADRNVLLYETLGNSLIAKPDMSNDDFNAYLNLTTEAMWQILLKYDYFGL